MSEPGATRAAVLLHEGVAGHEALGALAAFHAAGWNAELVAKDALVRTREGARLTPGRLGFDALAAAPVTVLCDGDVGRVLTDADLVRALRARRGRWTLAAGEAVRVAAAAGLADGRQVARAPGAADVAGTTPRAARLVADGRLLTSFGGDALIDLVLHHVAHEAGANAAETAAARLGRAFQPFALGASTD